MAPFGLHVAGNDPAACKNNALKPWLKEPWCRPPEANAELVWAREDVLDISHRPSSPKNPLLGLEESSKPPVIETRQPLRAEPGKPARDAYEDERTGVSHLLVLFAPLGGWRHVQGTDRRTKVDWAHGSKDVLPGHFPAADHLTLVMANLNTHQPASR